jgi:phage/plasmid-like protein (TIGR03299 family)
MTTTTVRKYPWLFTTGKTIENKLDYDAALKECKLDYTVHLEDMCTTNGVSVLDAKAVVRDDGHVICSTGSHTQLVQNIDKFSFFGDMIETGLVELHAGGVLKNGNRQFLLAKYKENYEVAPGDVVEHFVLCRDAYDNSASVSITDWAGRLICSNGLARIEQMNAIKFRHGKDVKNKVGLFRELLENTALDFKKTIETYKQLASKKIGHEWLAEYTMKILEVDDVDLLFNNDNQPIKRMRELQDAIHFGQGQNLESIKNTAWWAYNGVTNWLSHTKGRSNETRLDSLFWGDSKRVNQLAIETALTLAV